MSIFVFEQGNNSNNLKSNVMTQKNQSKSPINKIDLLNIEYDKLISQFRYYLDVNGFIYTKDFKEFFTWFKKFRHPNKPIAILEIHPNDLKLFHEYEVRRINNTGWDDAKEFKFLNDIEK